MAASGHARALAMEETEVQQVAGGDLAREEGVADGGEEPLLETRPATLGRALGGRALVVVAAVLVAAALACFSAGRLVGSHGSVTASGWLVGGGGTPPAEPSSSADLDATVELASSRRRRSRRRGTKSLTLNARRRRRWSKKLGAENTALKECGGDCNWDLVMDYPRYTTMDDCPGSLKCFRWGVPPGCEGKAYDGVGYCFKDPNSVLMIVGQKRARTDFEIALSHHKTPRVVDMVATSGETLAYHLKKAFEKGTGEYAYLNKGEAGTYKYVILQEYKRIPVYRSDRRRGAAKKFEDATNDLKALDDMVRDQGGKTVIFQSWGARDAFDEEMPVIRESTEIWQDHLTRRRRATYSPLIAPMGDAYANIKKWSNAEFMGLFEKDDPNHESEAARYLGAMVLYETVTGDSCIGLPGPVDTKFTSAKTKKFQEAAHDACKNVAKIR